MGGTPGGVLARHRPALALMMLDGDPLLTPSDYVLSST